MKRVCPRCNTSNRVVARYCRRCGLWLEPLAQGGSLPPGRWPHPAALPPPSGCAPIERSAQLWWRSESAFGGRTLLPTEGLRIALFNGGYTLEEVALEILGADQAGRQACRCTEQIERIEQGRLLTVELPSYEIQRPLRALRLRLLAARFAEDW